MTLADLFAKLKISRDSMLWTAGLIGAIVVGLAALITNDQTAAYYGLPLSFLPRLRLLSAIVAIVSAFAKTSPLYGRSNMPATLFLVLALGLGGASMSGCALTNAAVGRPTTDAAVLADLAGFADRANQALTATRDVQQIEIGLHASKIVSDPIHLDIQKGFRLFASNVRGPLNIMKDVAQAPSARQAAEGQFVSEVSKLVALVTAKIPAGAARTSVAIAFQVVSSTLLGVPPAGGL